MINKKQMMLQRTVRRFVAIAGSIALIVASFAAGPAQAAACAPPADYGSVSSSVSLPSTTTYRVWTHMFAPDTTNNTYLLQIDGTTCATVGGSSLSANSWQWTANQSSNAALDIALTSGTHSLKLIGNQPNVRVDRVIFTSDLTCTPTGDGTNCNVPTDTTLPTVKLTAPAPSANVSGTTTISATASDNIGVTKVELYANSGLLTTLTTAPYTFQWDTTKTPNGLQLIVAKAYDAAGNVGVDSYSVTVQNSDTQAPTTPSKVTATASAYNKVQLSWQASTDNVGVTSYTVIRDGVPLVTLGAVTSYTDTTTSANTTYNYQVQSSDAAGNKSVPSTAVSVHTPNVPDTLPPTQPGGLQASAVNQTQINLTWQASTDNVGVTSYDIYRSSGGAAQKIGSSPTTNFGDTSLSAKTTYTYYVIARDGAGNASAASATASATTLSNAHKKGLITGTITNKDTGKAIGRAWIYVPDGAHRHIYHAKRNGQYTIARLNTGTYNLLYQAQGYASVSAHINLGDGAVITNDVALQKR